MKRVLVLGGSGFIGSSITQFFARDSKYQVTSTYFSSEPPKITQVAWIKINLLDSVQTLNLFKKKFDVVINSAAVTSGANIISKNPEVHVLDNIRINSNIIEGISKGSHPNLFIFLSCTVMYPSSQVGIKESESIMIENIFPKYFASATTKMFVENLCRFYSSLTKTKFVIVRHTNIYGPGDKFNLEFGHVLSSLIIKMHNASGKVKLWGDGTEKRDFLYIDDFLKFIKLLINYKKLSSYTVFNVGSGKSIPIRELAKQIRNLVNKKIAIGYSKDSRQLKVNICVNIKKVEKELGWKPSTNLADGLVHTYSWYKSNLVNHS